jgi:hypothetical protein
MSSHHPFLTMRAAALVFAVAAAASVPASCVSKSETPPPPAAVGDFQPLARANFDSDEDPTALLDRVENQVRRLAPGARVIERLPRRLVLELDARALTTLEPEAAALQSDVPIRFTCDLRRAGGGGNVWTAVAQSFARADPELDRVPAARRAAAALPAAALRPR